MEGVVENSLEAFNYLTDKHFDKGWDKYRKQVNGKTVEDTGYVPYRGPANDPDRQLKASSDSSSSRQRGGRRPPTVRTASRARSKGAAPRSNLIASPAAAAAATGTAIGATTYTAAYPASRRRQRNSLPSPDRETYRAGTLQQESEESDRVLRAYELEVDDPQRRAESVLDSNDLNYLKESRRVAVTATPILADDRRDSAMASAYNDDYRSGDGYARDAPRPRSQPPRSRYYDDDDSDYDDRSGRRYRSGGGRGYDDDRDYDRVIEETERYRGPPMSRPQPTREESSRSGTEGPYGAGTVAQYGRRSDAALDREDSYVSRRTRASRGRDPSYSRSPSPRSPSPDGDRGGDRGIGDKIQGAFNTSGRGLGVGLAGAVIGGLAGREFGQKHRQRDIIIGAIVGGLGANAAENTWREYKNKKERSVEGDVEEWEQKWDGRGAGRSRSNVR